MKEIDFKTFNKMDKEGKIFLLSLPYCQLCDINMRKLIRCNIPFYKVTTNDEMDYISNGYGLVPNLIIYDYLGTHKGNFSGVIYERQIKKIRELI